MTDEALTFSELRKIQKQESRQDQLTELDDNFLLRVSNYLNAKEGDGREYRNAKRVFKKIVSLREEKIVKNAKLSVSSDVNASEMNMLPEEQELYRESRQVFQEHQERVNDRIDNGLGEVEAAKEDIETEAEEKDTEPETEELQESNKPEEDAEDGYEKVEIVSEVPEFMGTDLETYGPFNEGEEVKVPEENAEILVNRGNAEMIE